MSGNFVQRGELAIADKYTRAKWAIKSGVDAVIELPPEYVLTTAKYFALGAIKILNTIKADTVLSFGSEAGNMAKLKQAVQFEESNVFQNNFDKYISSGMGYAESYHNALKESDTDLAEILSSPNNILAVEYLKSLNQTNSKSTPITIKRLGHYNDTFAKWGFASASAIRQMLADKNLVGIEGYTPSYVYDYLKTLGCDNQEVACDKLLAVLKYNYDKTNAHYAHGVKEGIENRIYSCLVQSKNYRELIDNIATKRYTNSYIMRTLANIAIKNNFDAEDLQSKPVDYVNILAINENAKDILSLFDCNVVTKNSMLPKNSLIKTCDKLYSSIYSAMDNGMAIIKN